MNANQVALSETPHERPGHRRGRSATAIKSFIASKGHTSKDPKSPSTQVKESSTPYSPFAAPSMAILPPDHPHSGLTVLGEIDDTNAQSPPKPEGKPGGQDQRGLYTRTKSAISLRDLVNSRDGKAADTLNEKASSDPSGSIDDRKKGVKGTKSKSSVNLAAVFSKARGGKFHENFEAPPKDKENTTPPSSAGHTAHSPTWAEFPTQALLEPTATTKVPLNDRHTVADEIALYMPQAYSPSKQRNFHNFAKPTLGKKERPKSEGLAISKSATNFIEVLSRKKNDESSKSRQSLREKREQRVGSSGSDSSSQNEAASTSKPTPSSSNGNVSPRKKGSKVMAAVTMFDRKAKQAEIATSLDPKKIDAEFEAVLESRNIPENMRQKMRSLKTAVKADFIKSHKAETATTNPKQTIPDSRKATAEKPCIHTDEISADDKQELESYVQAEGQKAKGSTKRARPRSRTFTFSKSESSKKVKSNNVGEDKAAWGDVNVPRSPSTTSLGKSTVASAFGKAPNPTLPEEYVSYLRKVQKPEAVEVGRLHKLRLLLRNETIAWVDSFIRLGGMAEIVELLHRIMKIEWREEHEDSLLHEALLCLKGLCTTDLALQKLCDVESTLFPALLGMLFDPEHKGPSEFTTRAIVINLLFAHLTSATKDIETLPNQTVRILSYLQDPAPPADRKPLQFLLDMHQSRPYKVWCREIVNVTKEIFWIFLHHLNVIALPSPQSTASGNSQSHPTADRTADSPKPTALSAAPERPQPENLSAAEYLTRFFPQPRPPVPAAPYVGGVEWDATHYLSSQLDLLNALLSSLPTSSSRNDLRTELRASGFEKVMGGMLRTCKEKFYAHIHDGLGTWVGAAVADGWDVRDVRFGPKAEEVVRSPRKASPSKRQDKAPKIGEVPKLDLGLGIVPVGGGENGKARPICEDGEGWL